MTINVVCRRDAINRNRLAPLALVFTHDRRRKFVGLGISEALVHWDFDKQQPTADCPDRAEIQFQITSKIREYEKKIKKLEVLEIPVTFDTLFEQNGKRINCTVGEYFKQIIERLEKVEKYSSASKHKVTLVLVSQFRSVNMRFDELDLTYLREFEIFLSQKGNVNNSCNYAAFQYCRLYLIEILHQTTTHCKCIQFTLCCILSKFYIKPQLRLERELACCVVSYRNSTSNHNSRAASSISAGVVSYRNSTSNHNKWIDSVSWNRVVSYRNSTSNHNFGSPASVRIALYLIEILHQTTTPPAAYKAYGVLYLIEILHQTTTLAFSFLEEFPLYLIEILHQTTTPRVTGFLLLRLYLIEILHQTTTFGYSPVLARSLYLIEILHQTTTIFVATSVYRELYLIEILHQTTTWKSFIVCNLVLYLIEILHQTTTSSAVFGFLLCCILSKFYIKPQRRGWLTLWIGRCILSKFYIKPQHQ